MNNLQIGTIAEANKSSSSMKKGDLCILLKEPEDDIVLAFLQKNSQRLHVNPSHLSKVITHDLDKRDIEDEEHLLMLMAKVYRYTPTALDEHENYDSYWLHEDESVPTVEQIRKEVQVGMVISVWKVGSFSGEIDTPSVVIQVHRRVQQDSKQYMYYGEVIKVNDRTRAGYEVGQRISVREDNIFDYQ